MWWWEAVSWFPSIRFKSLESRPGMPRVSQSVDLSTSSSPFQHSGLPSFRAALIQTTPNDLLFLTESSLWCGDWQRNVACFGISLFFLYSSSQSSSSSAASEPSAGSHSACRLHSWLFFRQVFSPPTCMFYEMINCKWMKYHWGFLRYTYKIPFLEFGQILRNIINHEN